MTRSILFRGIGILDKELSSQKVAIKSHPLLVEDLADEISRYPALKFAIPATISLVSLRLLVRKFQITEVDGRPDIDNSIKLALEVLKSQCKVNFLFKDGNPLYGPKDLLNSIGRLESTFSDEQVATYHFLIELSTQHKLYQKYSDELKRDKEAIFQRFWNAVKNPN